ncbi:MAG: fimbrillin family protein [Muribaculaceae bacterium]|nr:fimbrillin family protein [Muribaculaceae bacterium]
MKYNPLQIATLIICCMLCVTSCSSDSVYEPESDKGVEMSFDMASESRATTTVLDEFSVYGEMKYQTGAADPIVIFDKTQVVNRDGVWSYKGTQYWFPKHEHSFVAVSPSSSLESTASPQYINSKLSFIFTMPTYSGKEMQETQDKNELLDIVAATHRRFYNGSEKDGVISLRFGHLLSKINFAPRFEDNTVKKDDYIQFHKIEISGLKKKAKIAVTPASLLENPQTDDRLIEFSEYDGTDNLTITFNGSKIVSNSQQINLFADADALKMLPQLFEATSEATVRFSYSFKEDSENQRVGSISLGGQEWKPGAAYTYNFTVDKMGLNLEKPTIKEWDSVNISDVKWIVE